MSAPLCTVCLDTGSKSQEIDGSLDCVVCNAVTNRLEMQNYLAGLSPLMNSEQRAWAAYNFGMRKTAAPVVPVAAQPVVPDAINNAFVTLVYDSGSYSISLKFNKNSDVWAVHDFLLRSGGKEYNAAAPQPAASVTDADLVALLPGPYYMDLPDGGSVTVLEQLQRMAKDAARYRWLRDFGHGNTSRPHSAWLATGSLRDGVSWLDSLKNTSEEIDTFIDAAIAAQQGEKTK